MQTWPIRRRYNTCPRNAVYEVPAEAEEQARQMVDANAGKYWVRDERLDGAAIPAPQFGTDVARAAPG